VAVPLLLIVRTTNRRYAIRRDDLAAIKVVASQHDLVADEAGRPYVAAELGPVLDPRDHTMLTRRRALVVPLRRRSVALLVDRVDDFLEHATTHPLPPIIATRLREPWATGALLLGEEVVVQIDIRAVARSVLLTA
jgi:hypothetical protein